MSKPIAKAENQQQRTQRFELIGSLHGLADGLTEDADVCHPQVATQLINEVIGHLVAYRKTLRAIPTNPATVADLNGRA